MQFPVSDVAKARILVVGDIMLDRYWFGEVDRISPEAPVPVVRVAKREDRLGGAANVARNASSLGANVSLFGIVGCDEPGNEIQDLVKQVGIKCELIADPDIQTTLKMRVLGRQQQLLRVDFEEMPSKKTITQLNNNIEKVIAAHDILVLSDYSKGTLSQVEALISMARNASVPVLIDPKGHKYNRYKGASLMTPNKQEMREAVGPWESEEDLYQKAQGLRNKLELEALLVTRSEEGMSLFTNNGAEHVAAHAHEVFDVSGAGDTVLATLAVTRAAGLPWNQAMAWANKAGGIVVGKLGTSVVSPKELL